MRLITTELRNAGVGACRQLEFSGVISRKCRMTSKSTHMAVKALDRNIVVSLSPVEDEEDSLILHAVIETPQGSRNKYKYDEEMGLFTLSKVLPAGSDFPFSFGFIPKTLAEDGDPLDVLVLADEPVPVGCVVPARLIGVLEAENIDQGDKERNDRLIAVATESNDHADLTSFKKINQNLMKEIEYFFAAYHQQRGHTFKILGCLGPSGGKKALDKGMEFFRRKRGSRRNGEK